MAKIVKHYYLNEESPKNIEIMIDITDGNEGLRAYSFDMEHIDELINDKLTLNTSIMVLTSNEKHEDGKVETDVKVSRNGLRALTKQDISKWDNCVLITEDNDNMNSEFIEHLYDSINNKIKESSKFKLFNEESKREISNLGYTEKLALSNRVRNVEFLLDLKLLNINDHSSNNKKEHSNVTKGQEFNMFDKQLEDSMGELNDVREQLNVSRGELGAIRKQTKIAKHSLEKANRDIQRLTGELESKRAEADKLDKELEEKLAYVEMANEDVDKVKEEKAKIEKKIKVLNIEVKNKENMLGIPYRPKDGRYIDTTIYKIDNRFKIYRGATVRENNGLGFIKTEGDIHYDSLGEMIDFITDGRNDGVWERVSY